jgi:hypothetical protein
MPLQREYCRRCRDRDEITVAEFIVWGRFFNKTYLGPQCEWDLPPSVRRNMSQIDQWAIYDLRPINRLLEKEDADQPI